LADTALFKTVEDEGDPEPHRYVVLEPVSPSTLAEDLAPRVKGVYFDERLARERLQAAAEALSEFDGSAFTEEDIETGVAQELNAVIPAAWGEPPDSELSDEQPEGSANEAGGDGDAPPPRRRPKQTDVRRSELGEIVCADVLRSVFETAIPASRLAHKETPDQQARGADVLGLEEPDGQTIVLVLAEVKGSTDAKSPPRVIDGMAEKLHQLATDRRVLQQELIWLRDHADDRHAAICTHICTAFLLGRKLFDVLLVPVLVRTASKAGDSDCGVFKTEPDSFGEKIRFVTVRVDDDLFELAKSVYEKVIGRETS
jgi:Cap4 SAVED domain